ncbi:MAG TPA: hypothetical protein VLI07_18855 [Candidatus Binatus sp.]|nr:hypothetical protein [Candidatus Binatus sp.]
MTDKTLAARVGGQLEVILKPLQDEVAELVAKREALEKELNEMILERKTEIRQYTVQIMRTRAVISAAERAIHPENVEKATPRKSPAIKTRSKEETIARVLKAFTDHPDRTFSNPELEKETGLHHTTVHSATNILRERQQIRLLGRRPREKGKMGAAMVHFALMPEEQRNGDE